MILFQNTLVTLDYDMTTDILTVKWPDVRIFAMDEIQEAFTILVENIKNYDIKKLLIDASQTSYTMPDEQYKELVVKLSQQLAATRLQKVARVVSRDVLREPGIKQISQQAQVNNATSIDLQFFEDKQRALGWLKGTSSLA